jgi:hypothetical protein
MNYEEKKEELEARYKPGSAAYRLELWLEDNPDMAPKPKAAPKAAKKEEVVEEEAKEE